MKKVSLVIAALLILSLLALAGCSSNTSPSSAAPVKTPTTAAPTSAASTTAPSTTAPAPASTATTAPSAAASAAAGSIELKLVHMLPDVPPGNVWVHMFADKVKKYSNGSVTVKILGSEAIPMPDAPSAAQRGTVDISNILMPFANAFIPAADSIGRSEYDPATLRKTNNPAYKYLSDGFSKAGLYFLGATSPSIPQYQTNFYLKKVATKLSDLTGWKIASSGGANKAFIESIGMVCVPLNFPDYFTSMERGTVDGYNIGTPGIQDFGLTPVTGCMLDECFSSCGSYMVMNMGAWNKLSKSQQDALTQAVIETESEGIGVFDQVVTKVRDDISKAGVKITKLSHEESVKFYLSYRNAMWADDIKKFGDAAKNMQSWLVDPNFSRTK